jgi:dynein heavy chain
VDHLESILEPLFFFCLIWSIGVTGTDASRIKFDAFFKDKLNPQSKIPFPTEATVYDYMFNETDKEFTLWSDQIKNFSIDPSLAYNEIMVQTSDSTRNLYLSKLLIVNNKNMLITGPTGTGKTQNALLLLSKQLGPDYQYVYMAFSA